METELTISQKQIDNLLNTIIEDLTNKQTIALNSLDTVVRRYALRLKQFYPFKFLLDIIFLLY